MQAENFASDMSIAIGAMFREAGTRHAWKEVKYRLF